MTENCPHEQFRADVNINRLEDTGRFIADLRVRCVQCDEPFRFLNVAAGLAWDRPMCSIDELELHAPIEPQGAPSLQTSARFEMPPVEIKH